MSNAMRRAPLRIEEVKAMRDGIAPSYVGDLRKRRALSYIGDLRRRRALSHVVEEMKAMRDGAKLSRKGYSLLVRHNYSHCL